MANINRTLDKIKEQFGPKVARSFSDAIRDLRSDVVLRRVIDALNNGNIEAALDALNIEQSVFNGMRQQLTAAYIESGTALVAAVRFEPPGETRAVVRFDVTNPVAERALREWLGTEITNITTQTREAARVALSEGFAKGQGPRQIALDVVGRVGPNGRRTGGVLGLSQQQEAHVRSMRAKLVSGDLRGVLRMTKRDRRFDRSIIKLIREGKTPTAAQINQWTGRYSDRLLKLRGDTIARTETAAAVEQGRNDGFRQGMLDKGIPLQYAVKEWRHGGGGMKPRVQHVAENETEVQGMDTPFTMPDGTLLQHPHDPNAPANHVINCLPSDAIISNVGLLGGVRHKYVGNLIKVSFGGEVDFSVTPNHPVLTSRGWVAASCVNVGDYVFSALDEFKALVEVDVNNIVSRADETYNSFHPLGSVSRSVGAVVDFHGHITDENIDIVSKNSSLLDGHEATSGEVFGELSLKDTDVISGDLFLPAKLSLGYLVASELSYGDVSGGSVALSNLWRRFGSPSVRSLATVGSLYSKIIKAAIDYTSASSNAFRYGVSRESIIEQLANDIVVLGPTNVSETCGPLVWDGKSVFAPKLVTHASETPYDGYVYNFTSENGILISNGVVNHNCTCSTLLRIDWARARRDGIV